jgi:hypothetical protein
MKTSGSVSYLAQVDKLPDNVFGVSQRRSGAIRRRLAEKGIEVVSATRVTNLTYLEFKNENEHERAVKWIYRWFEVEFDQPHWKSK